MMKEKLNQIVYIVLGIDIHEHDQVIAVFDSFNKATEYCRKNLKDPTGFYDLWIERRYLL